MKISIALVGDQDESVTAHQAIPLAIGLAADALQINITMEWISTEAVSTERLSQFHAIWCVPDSPYKNNEGTLTAIQFARRNDIPFLATCSGYQLAIVEFARHVLGFEKAMFEKSDGTAHNPETEMPLISALPGAPIEKSADIILATDSQVATYYQSKKNQSEKITEDYSSSFAVNQDYLFIFDGSDLYFSGQDNSCAPKIFEIPQHRFFIGTAFQPEKSANKGQIHPLITGLLQAAVEMKIATA
ncbi:MAG: CTP synthase (UTP-ammonia lyase) [Gammaproteobacteria bacterium]|jgi:CTP synthase (UTP-ammonia lyase)